MRYFERTPHYRTGFRQRYRRLLVIVAAASSLGMASAAPAWAGFEQVANFGESGEGNGLLSGVSGLAVNYTGAGGVPSGTLYSVKQAVGTGGQVSRWSPGGEFREAWGWHVSPNQAGPPKFERCGPDGEAAHPTCLGEGEGGEGEGQLEDPQGVAVDQSTGDVYVLNDGNNGAYRKHNLIEVFSADGSHLITEFGDSGTSGETIEQGPEKFHIQGTGGITVDTSGNVYVGDFDTAGGESERVMVWRPQSPGNYEHYVYAGRSVDIAGIGQSFSLDDTGRLYRRNGTAEIEAVSIGGGAPTCVYEFPQGGVQGVTVDPVSGEVFFWSQKTPHVVHQLSPCDAKGDFSQVGEIELTPITIGIGGTKIAALAFNPTLSWEGARPAGALYGASAGGGNTGYIVAPAKSFPPVIASQSASGVTANEATLDAQIDPKGFATRYVFQSETLAAYEANAPSERFAGASESPVGGGALPAVQGERPAAAVLSGLLSGTTYRYRVVTTSDGCPSEPEEKCEAAGETHSFRTYDAGEAGLLDGRQWELVTPVEKQGGEPFTLNPDHGSAARCAVGLAENGCKPGINIPSAPSLSSPDGEAIAYQGFPFSESDGAAHANEYISRRTLTGWQTTILSPAAMTGSFDAFDTQLTKSVLFQEQPSLTSVAPSEYQDLYGQAITEPGSLTPLVAGAPPYRESGSATNNVFKIRYAGASSDLSRVFFEANDALTGATAFAPAAADPGPSKFDLYEWHKSVLTLVNVLPGNAASAPGSEFGSHGGGSDLPDAISADGLVVFWSDGAGRLYARIDGERTVEVHDPGAYLTASADGSRVLLTDGCLYDLLSESCTDLTGGLGGFVGLAGTTEDLSHVYFVDTAVLTGVEENQYGARAKAGANNLYSWSGGQTTFVATLGGAVEAQTWNRNPLIRTAEASLDGRFLAFESSVSLTGFDNVGPSCGIDNFGKYVAGACSEAFLYDSAMGSLLCASCNPAGVTPIGPTRLPVTSKGNENYLPQARYLTDSGRLFFDSQDALSQFDTNHAVEGLDEKKEPSGAGAAGAEDVYEYEPDDVGDCVREGGCVALISGGRGAQDSNFLAADPSGENVFFTTRERLAPQDHDELMDVYDAREGGGFPPPEREAECLGEACQPAPLAWSAPSLASFGFEGVGNVKPSTTVSGKPAVKSRCPKGQHKVVKRNRTSCVKNKPRRKRKDKRAHAGSRHENVHNQHDGGTNR